VLVNGVFIQAVINQIDPEYIYGSEQFNINLLVMQGEYAFWKDVQTVFYLDKHI
jgi:hypothetical protein